MKLQFSAGGVVLRQAQDFGSKPQFSKNIEVLLCQHSQHHGWVFPKGLIDSKETKEQAALREVKEETGANGKIVKALTPTTYWFVFPRSSGSRGAGAKEKTKKTVYYFLMEYVGGDIMQHDHEMEAVEWLPREKVAERLTYKSDKKVWEEAQKLLVSS